MSLAPLFPTAGPFFEAVTQTMTHAVLVHAAASPWLLEPGGTTPPRALDQVLGIPFAAPSRVRHDLMTDFL